MSLHNLKVHIFFIEKELLVVYSDVICKSFNDLYRYHTLKRFFVVNKRMINTIATFFNT